MPITQGKPMRNFHKAPRSQTTGLMRRAGGGGKSAECLGTLSTNQGRRERGNLTDWEEEWHEGYLWGTHKPSRSTRSTKGNKRNGEGGKNLQKGSPVRLKGQGEKLLISETQMPPEGKKGKTGGGGGQVASDALKLSV